MNYQERITLRTKLTIKEPSYLYTLDTAVRNSIKRIRIISDYLYIKYNSFYSNITKEINNHREYDENYKIAFV